MPKVILTFRTNFTMQKRVSFPVGEAVMIVEQYLWRRPGGWEPEFAGRLADRAQLVFVFGGTSLIRERCCIADIRNAYPKAFIVGCSTAGEIIGNRVSDDTLVVTPVHFEFSRVRFYMERIEGMSNSREVGERLAGAFPAEELVHVVVFSEGLRINGSELVKGLTGILPPDVSVTGGLAGDGDLFHETYVVWNGEPLRDAVVAVGFYGGRLKVGYGSVGGWDPFGPERVITRSRDNILYEMDGKSALDLYKKYLGEQAKGLPASGLLFPLSLRIGSLGRPVVRTLLSIDEVAGSMTFAGDVPEGAYARLMKANFDRLIDGAVESARASREILGSQSPQLALLISCVGRKLILKQRVEEELDGARDILGAETILTGFYSYGEMCPFARGAQSELHNQTMTITALSEK
jgi:hypothetical protein